MRTKAEQIIELQRELTKKTDRLTAIVEKPEGNDGDLSRRQRAEVDQIRRDVDALRDSIPKFNPAQASAYLADRIGGMRDDDAQSDALKPEERVSDWQRDRGQLPARGFEDEPLSFGRLIRGAATGRWDDADAERRALSEGSLAGGGYMLAPELSGMVIDRVRNQMRVMQAGAVTVPLTTQQTYVPRLAGGGTVSWHSEGSTVTDTSPTFERVTFNVNTLPILVKISAELFEDLSPQATDLVEHEITQCLALELDRACLRGSGSTPEPTGIRNQSGVTITTLGTGNGAGVTAWDTMVDAVSVVRTNNIEPTAILWTPRTAQTHDKLKDSTGQPLQVPPGIAEIPRLSTNQIPTNLTVGSSNTCTEIYVGKFSDCLVGIRTDLRFDVRVLSERFIDNLQYGLLCYLRADIQLRHPLSFNVVTGCTS